MILVGVAFAAATPLMDFGLEEDDGGLVPASGDLQWEWGAPTTGPGAAHVGSRVWATQLDGPYLNDATGILVLPPYDLGGVAEPSLRFWHWTEIRTGDVARIEGADGQGGFELIEPPYGYPEPAGFTGDTGGWSQVYVNLAGFDDLSDVRLVFESDASVQGSGWYIDDLELWDGDIVPPQLSLLGVPSDTEDLDGPYVVQAEAEDDQGLAALELVWETAADSGRAEMVQFGETFAGGIPGQDPDTLVTWWVEASDGTNLAATDPLDFRVRLPAPTELAGPEGRVVDVAVELTWRAPESSHILESYRVYRDDELVAEPVEAFAEVPLGDDDTDVFEVSAVFDVGESDRSEPLVLAVSKPAIEQLDPDSAWQGDLVRLELVGRYLVLVEGEVAVDLGSGITVESIEVLDVDRAEVLVAVDENAEVAGRDLVLVTGGVEVVLEDAFEVLDGAGRPAITSIAPDVLRQGDADTLVVELTAEPAEGAVVVDLGEGVFVESIAVDGATLSVDVVVDPLAPLGLRPVLVDDGQRLLTGPELRVRDALSPEPTCAHVTVGPWFLVLLLLRRRR